MGTQLKLASASVAVATLAAMSYGYQAASAATVGPSACPTGYTGPVGGLCVDKPAYCRDMSWGVPQFPATEPYAWCIVHPIGSVPTHQPVAALPAKRTVVHVTNKVATLAAPVAHASSRFWSY